MLRKFPNFFLDFDIFLYSEPNWMAFMQVFDFFLYLQAKIGTMSAKIVNNRDFVI